MWVVGKLPWVRVVGFSSSPPKKKQQSHAGARGPRPPPACAACSRRSLWVWLRRSLATIEDHHGTRRRSVNPGDVAAVRPTPITAGSSGVRRGGRSCGGGGSRQGANEQGLPVQSSRVCDHELFSPKPGCSTKGGMHDSVRSTMNTASTYLTLRSIRWNCSADSYANNPSQQGLVGSETLRVHSHNTRKETQ